MSKIRLHGSSSGYTEIAPVAASGNNTLTLPNDGTIISKDSNGAVGVTSVTVGTGIKLTSSKLIISGDDSGVSGNADDLIIGSTSDSTARGLTIASTTNGNIRFSDAGDNATGMIEYNHSSNYMRMYVEAGEALRIDSSSNLKYNSGYGSVATAFGVRAWVSFNGTNMGLRGTGGVSSVGDNDTGDYTVNFDNNMPDTGYAVGGLSENWEGTNNDSYTQISGYTGGAAVGSYRFVTLRSRFDQHPPQKQDPPFVQLIFVR